jgi:hypothetical protein
MWLRWLPWRYVVSRLAKSHGFVDPITLLSKLHRFAQPSEVTEPIELLRAGVVFHARGLINTRTIQHNLDWVWPYWVERQFDPHDVAFIPRAFSITHVNLTHRNWTAVGLPDCDHLPIVDPRGLVTPLYDGWSLDAWLLRDDGMAIYPSRAAEVDQRLIVESNLEVETQVQNEAGYLRTRVDVVASGDGPTCRWRIEAASPQPAWLAVCLRPANPEGVSFVHEVRLVDTPCHWLVEEDARVLFDRPPERVLMSCYSDGDVAVKIPDGEPRRHQTCDVGLCTAAALYRLRAGERHDTVTVQVPLTRHGTSSAPAPALTRRVIPETVRKSVEPSDWSTVLRQRCALSSPDERVNELFDQAVLSLVLHAPEEVYPGPYTYKRFWFRDTALILDALLAIGQVARVRRAITRFPRRQTPFGYFHSQDGEWDSNGAALWIIDRYRRVSGDSLSEELLAAVKRGANWIANKRLSDSLDEPHAGLMPAGFSAEHLGPNDYYYWDDFWSAAGLKAAAAITRAVGTSSKAAAWEHEADRIMQAVERSLERSRARRDRNGIPASPYRRLDSGAIGSLAMSYPLALCAPDDRRLLDTVEFLLEQCTVHGGFFQDMIHSGINAYLTLHLAQVLLRSGTDGQQRYVRLLEAVRDLASPTGQWPEAIHPHTRGGCMGDGQHIWAAAEWVLMLRNLFIREEGDSLILASGIPRAWLQCDRPLEFGPTETSLGPVTVRIQRTEEGHRVSWSATWRHQPSRLRVALPTCTDVDVLPDQHAVEVRPSRVRQVSVS